jgi:hypothetical protein
VAGIWHDEALQKIWLIADSISATVLTEIKLANCAAKFKSASSIALLRFASPSKLRDTGRPFLRHL